MNQLSHRFGLGNRPEGWTSFIDKCTEFIVLGCKSQVSLFEALTWIQRYFLIKYMLNRLYICILYNVVCVLFVDALFNLNSESKLVKWLQVYATIGAFRRNYEVMYPENIVEIHRTVDSSSVEIKPEEDEKTLRHSVHHVFQSHET